MKKEKKSPEVSSLQQKAEAKIRKLDSGKAMLPGAPPEQSLSEAEMQKLIHKLQVYQIELEMQNAELQNAVEKAAIAIALYDFAPTGYFTVRPDSAISQLNLCGAKMLGKERLYLRNSHLNQFITPDTQPIFNEFLQKCFETSLKQICEIGLSISGKPLSFLHLEGLVTEDIHQCLVVAVDITERKRAEESLRESEKMYRLLARNLPETSVFLFDHNLRFILAEGFIHPEFAFTTTQLEGKTLMEVLPKERAEFLTPLFQNVLKGRATENLISEYKGHSYSVNILPVKNKQGWLIAGMVVSQDITARVQAEEALKSNYSLLRIAGETAKFGGWFFNLADNKVTWSDQVAAIHEMPAGYSPTLDEGINFYAPEWRDKVTKIIGDCVKNGIPFDEEMELITANVNRIWVRVIGEAVRNENGRIIKIQGAFQNINERKRADHALRESEEKWRMLVNTIPDYVALYDRDGKYLFLNRFAEGFSMKDIEGKMYTDFLSEESKLIYKQTFELARQTKTNQYVEHTALGDNRSIRHYESFFVPIFENDQLENMMIIARDITERKQIENELAQEKTLIDAIFNSVPGLIYLYDLEGNLIRWNKKHELITGYTSEELSNIKLLDWYKGDKKSQEAVTEGIKATVSKGFGTAEARLQKKDGTIIPMYLTASPLTINGKEYFTGIGIDITALKQAETALKEGKKKYRTLLEFAPDAFFQGDTKGNFITVNNMATEITGFSREELLSMNISELFSTTSLIVSPLRYDLLKCENTIINERVLTTKTGKQIQVEMNSKLMNDKTYQCFIRDITERKLAEQALKEREATLRELNATKDKFFSIIAHDLKSPFNSILGFSSLLTRQIQEKDYAAIEKYAGIIHNSSQQALDLLINLLEWSRMQTGRMVFSPESFDIVDLINQSTELLNASALQKSITIYSKMPVNLPVFADKAMISTILRNLLSNAIKFTDPGGEVVISTEQVPDELVVSVLDNGVGINTESIGKLFRIDENYSTLGTQKEKGTGLGLLLCKEFIDKHGGRIWVESEQEKGSRFFFSIPYRI